MQPPKKLVIVAGEESGDFHAATMIRKLRAIDPAIDISGIGGQHMLNEGVPLVSDLARYGVTGLTAIIRYGMIIRKAFKLIQAHLEATKPDLLVLIDYPGFNLRLAKFAKEKLGLRIVYYISPQIWAWKAKRINTIRACIDHMAVILPFEKAIYQNAGVQVSFVGHPLMKTIPHYDNIPQVKEKLGLPHNSKLVALLPGSRRNEIEYHMPVMVETARNLSKQHPNIHFVIPVAGTINPDKIKQYFNGYSIPVTLINGQALDVAACSDCVVVASGTASLECALLKKPMCIIYKASLLTYFIAFKVIRVKYLGLCNLLSNQMVVPELLQYDCNAKELTIMIKELLDNQEMINKMQNRLGMMKQSLSGEQADISISELVERELALQSLT